MISYLKLWQLCDGRNQNVDCEYFVPVSVQGARRPENRLQAVHHNAVRERVLESFARATICGINLRKPLFSLGLSYKAVGGCGVG